MEALTGKINDFVEGPFFMEDWNMLVLTRKPGEKINIGSDITLTVLEIRGNKIRLGIDAPKEIPVLRAELNDYLGTEGGLVGAGNGR